MGHDLDTCASVFLKDHEKLFGDQLFFTVEEAKEFLEECSYAILDDISQIREFFAEEGMDTGDLSDQELIESYEVFSLPDGCYLVVIA